MSNLIIEKLLAKSQRTDSRNSVLATRFAST